MLFGNVAKLLLPSPDDVHVLLCAMAQVDIPPPFSFMPKPVLTAAGNTALQGSTQIIMVRVSISKKVERTGTASHMSCMRHAEASGLWHCRHAVN